MGFCRKDGHEEKRGTPKSLHKCRNPSVSKKSIAQRNRFVNPVDNDLPLVYNNNVSNYAMNFMFVACIALWLARAHDIKEDIVYDCNDTLAASRIL